jgi:RNA-binding protein Musashi
VVVAVGEEAMRGEEAGAMEAADYEKLFVGGISWETRENRLREYFGRFGEVTEAAIMRDRSTGRARGFGFVVFTDAAVAERVTMEKHMIDGRMVTVPSTDQFCSKAASFCLT